MWMQKHGIEIAKGHGSQLAGVNMHQRVAEFFLLLLFYCPCRMCYGMTLYLPLLRRIVPHILLKISTHSLPFIFTYIFGVARWGHAKKGRM